MATIDESHEHHASTVEVDAFDIAEIESAEQALKSKDYAQVSKQCRITLHPDHLAASAPNKRFLNLDWHKGRGGRLERITLRPGESAVQPLDKAQAWFGPFALPSEYRVTTDEARRARLAQAWEIEKKRVLDRYDYPRPLKMDKDGREPIGPHRFPHVIVEILEPDGSSSGPMDLHKLYKIGAWDPLKDTFLAPAETPAQMQARYEREIAEADRIHQSEVAALRRQMAEFQGKLDGFLAATANGGKKTAAGA